MGNLAQERAARALRRHAPEWAGARIRELGRGLDHVVLVAGDLVLRVADRPGVVREARLLEIVAPRVPLPVPRPRFADAAAGVLAYRLLPGRPLLGRAAAPGTAARLGRFLRALHAVDVAAVAGLVPVDDADPGEWLADLDGPPELLRVVHASVPKPSGRRVLAHADLGAEHLLDDGGGVTGVIDWSDAAVTDPALDFARLYRDFGPGFLAEALRVYGGLDDDALPRITFFARCAALEDLAYGQASGRTGYAEAALRSITWLFPR
ncbi:phosphotransferase [Pseudonocardia sp. H11422]|uniref:phosphotransferase n=1 Tax=Pseudonocardia sp. H11422 TaxID=2835866 RepID=UPI001BDDC00C|nr:phosphotransferase [Pseudonocardia sp. H11422]